MNIIIYNENTTLYLEGKIKKINNKDDIKGKKMEIIVDENALDVIPEEILKKNFLDYNQNKENKITALLKKLNKEQKKLNEEQKKLQKLKIKYADLIKIDNKEKQIKELDKEIVIKKDELNSISSKIEYIRDNFSNFGDFLNKFEKFIRNNDYTDNYDDYDNFF